MVVLWMGVMAVETQFSFQYKKKNFTFKGFLGLMGTQETKKSMMIPRFQSW